MFVVVYMIIFTCFLYKLPLTLCLPHQATVTLYYAVATSPSSNCGVRVSSGGDHGRPCPTERRDSVTVALKLPLFSQLRPTRPNSVTLHACHSDTINNLLLSTNFSKQMS